VCTLLVSELAKGQNCFVLRVTCSGEIFRNLMEGMGAQYNALMQGMSLV